jgi:hypothetical protein
MTNKSPKATFFAVLRVEQATLSVFFNRNSSENFTQTRLLACLVTNTSLGLDYRGSEGLPDDSDDLWQLI